MSDWLDAEAHADRALEMYERGKWAEAEAELRKAISLNPDQAEWHFNLGLTLEHSGKDQDALECYERAIQLLPEQTDPLIAAGAACNRLGLCEKAIEFLDRALKLNAKLESAYAHKIESQLRLGQHDDAETTFYIAQNMLEEPSAQCLAVMAESLIQRGLNERAEWCLKEALRLDPEMPRLRARLAAVSAATGRPQRALQLYLQELRDDPGGIDTLLEYGDLLCELGRMPEAAEKFRRVLELEPANVDAHFGLGQIALGSRRLEQATLEFELVLKLDSQYPGVRLAMGESLLAREDQAAAKRLLLEEFESVRRADRSVPSTADASMTPPYPRADMIRLAELLLDAAEPSAAATLLQEAIVEEETADLLRLLALARFRSGDRGGGAAASRRALRKDPNCLRSIHNLALAALEQRRLRIAAGWIRRGLMVNRHDSGLRRLRMRLWVAWIEQRWRQMAAAAFG